MYLDLMHNPPERGWTEVENVYTAARLVTDRTTELDKGAVELTGRQWAAVAWALAVAADPGSESHAEPATSDDLRSALAAVCDSLRITLID